MKVAINGFGRIGRLLFRLILEDEDIDVIKQAYREYKEEGNPPILGEEGDEIEYE